MSAVLERHKHHAMGSPWEVVLPAGSGDQGARAARAAFAEVDRLEALLSRFRPRSDLSRLHNAKAGEWVLVAPETTECVLLAARLAQLTGGAFDPTFRSRPGGVGPGLGNLAVDEKRCALLRDDERLVLDLGALGKGHAVDVCVALLQEWGVESALVQGGESSAFAWGEWKPGARWTIGLRDDDAGRTLDVVELDGRALSGSGTFVQGAHIIDPRTGQAAARRNACWAASTSAALSDALSTAFMILSPEEIAATCAAEPDFGAGIIEGGKLRAFGRFP